jgi:hypothetical protein
MPGSGGKMDVIYIDDYKLTVDLVAEIQRLFGSGVSMVKLVEPDGDVHIVLAHPR